MGLGTDGAAVMIGCRNGVGVKLKEHTNMMVQVHCVTHTTSLSCISDKQWHCIFRELSQIH